jgi:tetratricopeptide (TPR) repeat protein
VRRRAWVLLALLAAYLVFIGGGWLGIYTTELRVITVSLTGVLLAVWAIVAWRDPFWRPRTVMAPALIACLGSLAISTMFSRVPRVSLEYLGYAILLAALYLLLVRLMASPFFRGRLASFGAVMFVAISAYFLVSVVFLWIQWWGAVGHLAIPPLRPNSIGLSWGNPSAILTIVALFAVPAAALWSSWTPRGIAAFVGIVVVVGVEAILSGSRAGWLGLGIAGVFGMIAAVASPGLRARVRIALGASAAVSRRVWVVGLFAGIFVVATAAVAGPAIFQRVTAGGEDLRTTFYVTAIRMFLASPIVGTGPGTWVIQRIAYTYAPEPDYYIPHAHDVPLQTLAEQGVVGAIAGLVLIANLGMLLWSAARSADGVRRRWAWITALGLIYLAGHDLLDFYPNMPAILFAAVLPVAWLDGTAADTTRLSGRKIGFRFGQLVEAPLASGLVVVLVATGGLLLQEFPSHNLDLALSAADREDWSAASAAADAAVAADPSISPYDFEAGLAAANLGDHQKAAADFELVAMRDDFPAAWLNLAAEQAELGEHDSAEASLRRALRLGIQHVDIAIPAGQLALQLGEMQAATDAFAAALAEVPSLGADGWWKSDPNRAALLPQVLDAAYKQATPDARWELALMTGDSQHAKALAAGATDPRRALLVIAAWTGDSSALDTLLVDCSKHSLDFFLVAWCSRIENLSGNQAEVARLKAVLEGLGGGSSLAGLELRVLTHETRGPYGVPSSSFGWFVYTYRRTGPILMLVPSLVHLRYA